jgi:4-amino-4-deoxy-L-arabinose transferase-like glycosyltransferase
MMRDLKESQSRAFSDRRGLLLNRENWFFILVFLLALILRITGLDFLLPHFEAGDEKDIVESSLNIIRTGDFNPHFFWYGSFPIYWITAIYYLVILILWPFSGQPSLAVFIEGLNVHDYHCLFFYIGRITSVFFGLLTIYLLYEIGKNLFGKKAGKLIVLLSSFDAFHVTFSQIFKIDISLSFWILATVYFALKIMESGKTRNYLLGGVCAGLAMSTKYNFLAFVPLVAANILKDKNWKSIFDLKLLLAGYVAVAVFVVTCPFSMLDFQSFYSQLFFQMNVLQQVYYLDASFFKTEIPYLSHLILMGLSNPLISFLSVFGMISFFRRDWRSAVLVISFPVIYFVFAFGISKLPNPQNIFPIIPFQIILCGFFFHQLFENKKFWYRYLGVGIFIMNIILQIFCLVYSPPYAAWANPYVKSGNWIDKNINKSSIVMSYYGNLGNIHYVESSFGFAQEYLIKPKLNKFEENLAKIKPDFLILMNWGMEHQNNNYFKNYGKWVNDILKKPFSDYCLVKGFYLPKMYRGISEKLIPVSKDYGLLVFGKKAGSRCEKLDF